MAHVFWQLLKLSFSASFLVLAVLAARLLLRKAPKGMICALWALVALRLMCPFSIESRLSLVPQTPLPHQEPIVISQPEIPATIPAADPIPAQVPTEAAIRPAAQNTITVPEVPHIQEVPETADHAAPADLWGTVGAALWLLGCTGMLIYGILSFWNIHRQTAASVLLSDGIYLCDDIGSPFLLGIFRPKIYLPSDLTPEETRYVLAHERMHLKWKDHWWKPLGFVLLAFHWFNPLMWVAYLLLCRDIESACDQRVVRTLSHQQQANYAKTLLNCSVPRHLRICPVAFGEDNVKQRIQDVLHYKKPTFFLKALGLIALILVAVCFATIPNRHSLLEISGVSQPSQLFVDSDDFHLQLSHPDDLNACLHMMEEVRCTPVSVTDGSAPDRADSIIFSFGGNGQMVQLTFSPDFKILSIKEDQNTIAVYNLKDPQLVQTFLDIQAAPVVKNPVSGSPEADLFAPWTWTEDLNLSQISQARYVWIEPPYYIRDVRMNGSRIDGYCTKPRVEKLISVLNKLNAQDFTAVTPPKGRTAKALIAPESKLVSVILEDPIHQIAAVLQYDTQKVTLLFSPDAAEFSIENIGDNPLSELSAWEIQDAALLSCMEEFLRHPSVVEADRDLAVAYTNQVRSSGSGLSLSLALPDNWQYQVVSQATSEAAFGIRCRPGAEIDGWLCYLCIPNHRNSEIELSGDYTILRRMPDTGHYLVLKYEDTYHWTPKYQKVIDAIAEQAELSVSDNPSLTDLTGITNPSLVEIVARQKQLYFRGAKSCQAFSELWDSIFCDAVPVETHVLIGNSSDYPWDGTRIRLDGRQWHDRPTTFGFSSDFQYFYQPEQPLALGASTFYADVYRIQNSQDLRDFMDYCLDSVIQETASGTPYADLSAPWTWTRELKLSQLAEARFTQGTKRMRILLSHWEPVSGYCSRPHTQQLIEILNTLRPEDFTPITPSRNCTAADLMGVEHQELGISAFSILLQDSVHEIAALLQFDSKTVRLVISTQPQAFSQNTDQILTDLAAWEIHNEDLLDYMASFASYYPIIISMPQMLPVS